MGGTVDKWTKEKKTTSLKKEALESMSARAFLVLLDTYFMTSYCCAMYKMYMYAQNLC